MNKISFLLFSGKKSRKISKIFFGISEKIQYFFPKFEILLQQANINLKKDSFFALVLLNTFIYFLFFTISFSAVSYYLNLENYILFGLIFGLIISSLIFLRIIFEVKLIVLKKIKSIESNLIFGLKIFLVELNQE